MTGRACGPFDLVLLDVNGTLVPSLPGSRPDAEATRLFPVLVRRLTAEGVVVGLCSDSPAEQLWEYGRRLGLGLDAASGAAPGFPVVAENGNVAADGTGTIDVVTPFPDRSVVCGEVARAAAAHGLHRTGDVTAPEFGGTEPAAGEWAFGANRRASVSVFGPSPFVHEVRRRVPTAIARGRADLSVEFRPDHRYAVIHPYAPVERGKRIALARLAIRTPQRTLVVGNSPADWIPGVPGVRCAFVRDPAVTGEMREASWYASEKNDLEGVVDILENVLRHQVSPTANARV
ncbi:hypothetical protein [Streptomyces canus]|uniref:hypothetical protein n=1 Tax=Streptomyces canus TaxID=58343 RepID=UPI0032445778